MTMMSDYIEAKQSIRADLLKVTAHYDVNDLGELVAMPSNTELLAQDPLIFPEVADDSDMQANPTAWWPLARMKPGAEQMLADARQAIRDAAECAG